LPVEVRVSPLIDIRYTIAQGGGVAERDLSTETTAQRWLRRTLTLPAYGLAAIALPVLAPLLLPLLAVVDLVRRERFARVRLLLFGVHYLVCEVLGLMASFGLWVARRIGARDEQFLSRHYALQQIWARALFAGVQRLFGLRLEVEIPDALPRVPLLVFVRHVSLVDALLPAIVLSRRHDLRLRYVLKRELLWDPCLDVVGNRLPNLFVDRDAPVSALEIEKVARLAEGLEAGEGVLIYPEGTRFTPQRHARAIAHIERSGDAKRLARARRFRHVLPPRAGGPIALLEACPEADILVVAHLGLEGLSHVRDVVRGGLIDRRLKVQIWSLPRSGIPRERDKQIDWLHDTWEQVDAWIDEQRSSSQASDE
jgi:1-acyl-sn-glycerol-3-phosphate acyltransferase